MELERALSKRKEVRYYDLKLQQRISGYPTLYEKFKMALFDSFTDGWTNGYDSYESMPLNSYTTKLRRYSLTEIRKGVGAEKLYGVRKTFMEKHRRLATVYYRESIDIYDGGNERNIGANFKMIPCISIQKLSRYTKARSQVYPLYMFKMSGGN